MKYRYTIRELLELIDEPNKEGCRKLYEAHKNAFFKSPGSVHNHQPWIGGYHDHITEIMNIGKVLFETLNELRPLPFSLSDVLLVCYLHDIEKPWKYFRDSDNQLQVKPSLIHKKAQHKFRAKLIRRCGIELSEDQQNAMLYVEGEGESYSSRKRLMRPLAALCHLADVTSARIWFNHPLIKNDPWEGQPRCVPNFEEK